MDLYLRNGRRWSFYDGYIIPVLNRASLIIRRFSTAQKLIIFHSVLCLLVELSQYAYCYCVVQILLDNSNTAIGVKYIRHGIKYKAFASKEVILSAGAIQSAKLLLLSGIGPNDLLVGLNLQDKYGAYVGPFTLAPHSAETLHELTHQMPLNGS